MTLQKLWSGCKKSLVVVTLETFVRCHRTGSGWYWSWLSRAPHRQGRKAVSQEVHDLIFRMVAENPTWGAPGRRGELLMLGFDFSEPSVSLMDETCTPEGRRLLHAHCLFERLANFGEIGLDLQRS